MAEDGNTETVRTHQSSESVTVGADMDIETKCSVCSQGDNKSAGAVVLCLECSEYLCGACRHHHQNLKLTRDHHLQGLDSESNDIESKETTNTGTEYCLEHSGNPILHYCETHDALCCKHCKDISHRHCLQVKYIPDECSGIMASNTIETVEESLKTTKEKLEEHIDVMKKQNVHLTEQVAVALIQIKTERTSAIELINKLADAAEKEVHSKSGDISTNISGEAETCQSALHALSVAETSLKTVKHNANEAQIYITSKKADQTARKYSKYVTEVEDNIPDIEFQFKIDSAFHSIPDTIKRMGTVTTGILEGEDKQPSRTSSATSITSTPSYKRKTAIPLGGHSARIHGDKTTCYITGCEILEDGRIVLADYNNKSMKVFDRYGKYSNHMFVSSRPTDIAVIGNEEVVTSLIDEVALQVLSVRKQIFLARRLDTAFPYYGLAFANNGTLYGSTVFKDGTGEIHVMDLTGRILHSIAQSQVNPILTRPLTIRINDDMGLLYVTDVGRNRVVCLDVSSLAETDNKRPVFMYTDRNLELRNGLAIDAEGNVYVCSGNRTVHQISNDGKKVHEILTLADGIELPHCMAVSRQNNHLLMCEFKQNMFKLYALQ